MKTKSHFNKFIFASIFFHFVLFFALLLAPVIDNMLKPQQIEVVLMDADELKKAQELEPQQIVETDSQHANNQKNDDAKFQSEKNNMVDKQTRAKVGEQFKNSLKQGQKTAVAAPAKMKSASQILSNTFDPYAVMVRKNNEMENKQAQTQKQTGANAGETSTTNDSLNVTEDLITKLNTKEYKYYGYYHRIKSQLNQWWQPKVREKVTKLVNQGRKIATEDNKITKLIIVLNNAGTLVKVQVLAESGVRDLDDAAIEAFRSAAPFPNPPRGIIESDGNIRIRWDFVIES